jgi:hypothetical protein
MEPTYYQRHRQRYLERQKLYNDTHKEEIKAYNQEYFQQNKQRIYAKKRAKQVTKPPKPPKEPKPKKQKTPPPTPGVSVLEQIILEPPPPAEPNIEIISTPIVVRFD